MSICYNCYKSGEAQCRLASLIRRESVTLTKDSHPANAVYEYIFCRVSVQSKPQLCTSFAPASHQLRNHLPTARVLPKPNKPLPAISCPLPPIPSGLFVQFSNQLIVVRGIGRRPQQVLWRLVLFLVAVVEQRVEGVDVAQLGLGIGRRERFGSLGAERQNLLEGQVWADGR